MAVTYSDGEFIVDDPKLEQFLLKSAAEWGVTIEEVVERALDTALAVHDEDQG